MNSREYLKGELENLIKIFPQLKIKYQFDDFEKVHLIEVLPLCDFDNNEEYQNAEAEITFEFEKIFYPETVLFISEESLTKVTKPEYELNYSKLDNYILEELIISSEEFVSQTNFNFKHMEDYSGDKYNYALAA